MRILNREILTSHGNIEGRKIITEILESGLQAADPYYNTYNLVKIENNILYVGYPEYNPVGSPKTEVEMHDLNTIDRIFIFGAGKGIHRIVLALEEILGDKLTGGHIIIKHGDSVKLNKVGITFAGHPIPDEYCKEGCEKIVQIIESAKLKPSDLVFTVIGNGVSSLLTLPPEGLTINQVKEVTRILQIEKGVPTRDLNYIRNQIDQLKGGRITRKIYPAKMVHILAIDANEKEVNGKYGYDGLIHHNFWLHTMPDITSTEEAINILKRYNAWDAISNEIKDYLITKGNQNPVLSAEEFERMNCRIFGIMPVVNNNLTAAMKKANELGFSSYLLARKTFVEARTAGVLLSRIAKLIEDENQPFVTPCAIFMGGELLVTVGKEKGIGGRNQEFALAAATAISGSDRIIIASVDTDGTDGPGGKFCNEAEQMGCTVLAGGIVDGYTVREAYNMGINIENALDIHNTSEVLWKVGSGIWATQNISIQDLIVILILGRR